MKQMLTTLCLVLATVFSAMGASPGEESRARRVPTVTGDGTKIYGEVTYSNSMNDIENPADAITWGLYSFSATSPIVMKPESIHKTLSANGGGTYRKGKVYFTSYYEDMTGDLGYLYFIEMDFANPENIERHALRPDTYGAIAADMTYDPVGDKIYGVAFDPADNTGSTYVLATYDIATGYPAKVASIDRMSAIACDNLGQLWGVRYSDGKLCRINKVDATVTPVGDTGVNPIYNGTACFDFETGKLYWSTAERTTELSGLYEININTGAASLIANYPDGEMLSTLFIPRADDKTLLNTVSNLKANFSGSSLEGTISFNAPSATKNNTPLSGDVTVSGYLDDTLNFSIPVAPGEAVERPYTLTQGMHNFKVVATHPTGGRSEFASLDFYVGSDGPAAVTDLKAEKTAANTVHLTWTQPSKGEHGGTVNPNLIYYKITRRPDNKVLTEEATGTEYTDNLPAQLLRRYTYEITGYYRNMEGATATSPAVEAGAPAALPYKQTFDTFNDYLTFVERDDNPDTERPAEGYWDWYSEEKCAGYKYHTLLPGDDWLITPGFELKAGMSYRLKFNVRTSNRYYPETLEVRMGHGYSPEEMNKTLLKRTDILTPDLKYVEREIVFDVPEDGNWYIGFHAVTKKGQYFLYIDDVALEEGVSMSAPGLATEIEVLPGSEPSKVDVSFKAPAVDLFGNALADLTEIKVLRGDKPVKTFTSADDLAPGNKMSFIDTDVPAGKNTYSIVASNSHGAGNPVEAEVFAGLDVPAAVASATHTTADGKNAVVKWTASTTGAHGGSVAYEPVKYRIYDRYENVVADNVEGTEWTHTTIDTSKGQLNMYYYVCPVNTAGEGEGAVTGFITYGKPYQDAFAESFAGGKGTTTSDWMISLITPSPYDNGFYGRYFAFSHNPNDKDRGPKPEAQDKDGGMLVAYTDFIDVESRMISPKINVSGLRNPVLSFWFYHYYNPDLENGYSTEKETMTVETYIDGEYKALTEKPILLINGNGWYRYDLPLKEAVGAKDFQIAFRTHNYISYDMHVDNITVHDTPDNDLQIQSFTLPANIAVNSTRNASVTVFNNGILPARDFKVLLYRDDKKVAEQTPDTELAFAKSATFRFPVSPDIVQAGKNFKYHAVIEFDADANPADNKSQTVTVQIPGNTLPKVADLKGRVADSKVVLSWSEPDMTTPGTVTDGFEGYEAFTITNFGSWQLYDIDGSLTYTISNSGSASGDYEYPNAGSQMAFQIFNPSAIDMKGDLWTPYLGNQMAVCFAAAERNNDDWLISPEVKGGTKVSFMARSVVDSYGLDKIRFCWTDVEEPTVADFRQLEQTISVPAKDWTRYEFTLPENALHFAINCVSEQTYALLIDEVSYESANADVLEFRGYNVYRDGVKLNDEIVEENDFTDPQPLGATENRVYNVSAVYDKGESCLSNDAMVSLSSVEEIAGTSMLVRAGKGMIEIFNAGGAEVSIIDINGISSFCSEIGDYARVSLSAGIYLVRCGDKTVKAIVR